MEEKRLRFTVGIISYNIEEYIERAIKSVVDQEFEDYEILIVDDCSVDNTVNKAMKYKSDKVKILKTQKNTGTAGGPRNIVIDNAKGDFIIFLDGDDTLYDSKTLKKIDKIIGDDNPDLIYLGFKDAGQSNRERISNTENSTKVARLICDLTFSVSSRCWNRKFLIKNNMKFIEGTYYEDEIYSMKATILANNTKCSNLKIFKYYRDRKGSVMSTPSVKKCSDWYRMLAEIMDLYSITPDEYKPYLLSFIKNENNSIPQRIAAILKALGKGEKIKQLPKRDYKYIDFFE